MATERTLSIIKPDATRRNLTGQINAVLGRRRPAHRRAEAHAADPGAGRGILRRAQGAAVLPWPGRVHDLRPGGRAGAGRRECGREEPRGDGRDRSEEGRAGTIRAQFAEDIEANSVHGSDSAENAAIEIGFFFAQVEIVG